MGLAMMGDMLLYVVLPTNAGAAGIGVGSLGLILSVNRVVRLGANTVAGIVYDRVGGRQPFLCAMALAVASTLGYTLADGFWPLLLARLAWGVAFSLLTVGAYSMLLGVTTEEDRGRAIGSYQSLLQAGMFCALMAGGFLTDLVGYRRALALYTGLAAAGWLVALMGVRETAARPSLLAALGDRWGLRSRGAGVAEAPPLGGGRPTAWLLALASVDRRLLAAGYVNLVIYFCWSGVVMTTLGLYLRAEVPGTAAVASLTGVLLAMRRLVIIALAPAAGRLSDAWGRRPLAAAGTATSLAGFLVLVWARGLWATVLGLLVAAVGEAVLHPALAARVGDLAPQGRKGVVMAGFATAADIGAAAGPLVAYALAAALGLRWAYALCAALLASALAVLLRSR